MSDALHEPGLPPLQGVGLAVFVTSVALVALSTLVVGLRVYIRWLEKSIWWDDALMLSGLVSYLPTQSNDRLTTLTICVIDLIHRRRLPFLQSDTCRPRPPKHISNTGPADRGEDVHDDMDDRLHGVSRLGQELHLHDHAAAHCVHEAHPLLSPRPAVLLCCQLFHFVRGDIGPVPPGRGELGPPTIRRRQSLVWE